MSNGAEDQSLLERVEAPSIPQEAQKKIANLQEEFVRAEVEQLRQSVPLLTPLFKKRNEIISHPEVQGDFWIRVFSSAPAEIDEYILPTDAAVLGAALKNLTVERFEVDAKGQGEPRSLRFTFDFQTGEENPFFENSQLVKEFYWRKQIIKTQSGKRRTWEGLVSEPVRINWKPDMDVTKGLLDAACDLAEAEKKGGDRKKLPEYETLVKKIGELEAEAMKDDEDENEDEDPESPAGTSFFSFFGYRGRDVSAEQSKEANKEDDERWVKISKGEEVEDDDEEDDDEDDEELVDDLEDAEIFPDGEELAIALAEDLWTDAMKYYVQSFELSDDLSELDMEELDEMDEDDDEDEEDGESQPRKKVRT
ncbi:uncharacterized protein N7459_008149 [Penicillium hispanicum]|uniref:uncharacterized protein n=1 Tax=Penicillium hispanicum TaxID=1080232 RepID=UPI0025415588|nr:uncharacterized protein N7459_008149 [Penicillium hispanicum]KAJ5573722.1 hypothetical protein N7459_008149 [Penicillium hispanicum]